jgi:hypothetical protein
MRKLKNSGLANLGRAATTVFLVVAATGLGEFASAAKPDKPRGKTANAPASATILAATGLVHDGVNVYVDYRVDGSNDCLIFIVPAQDGADGGRATFFHYGPDNGQCFDFPGRALRSFGVSYTEHDLNGDNDGSPGAEDGLRGHFRCFDVFTADTTDAYCWFRIYAGPNTGGAAAFRIDWPSVMVEVDESNADVRTVTNVGDATIYQTVETINPRNGKVNTALELQGAESIPLDIRFERLSF